MKLSNMFASRLHPLVNKVCVVLPKRRRNKILNVFLYTVILKNCQLRFSHNYAVLSLIKYPR